jgi:hypothetical protein
LERPFPVNIDFAGPAARLSVVAAHKDQRVVAAEPTTAHAEWKKHTCAWSVRCTLSASEARSFDNQRASEDPPPNSAARPTNIVFSHCQRIDQEKTRSG